MFDNKYQDLSEKIIQFTKHTLQESGLNNIIIGLSGGVDSATSAFLVSKAIGIKNMFVVMMPYGNLHPQGLEQAQQVIAKLQIPQEQVLIIDIKPTVTEILGQASCDLLGLQSEKMDNLRVGNIMARTRMIFLYDLAKKHNALVCGTENKTEYHLGYFTRFGDEASDIELIRGLYKTQIWELAQYLGVPEDIITAQPTAGLWEGQTDEGEMGFTYKDADRVLSLHFDKGLSKESIVAKGFAKELVEKIFEQIVKNDFKHHVPFVFK